MTKITIGWTRCQNVKKKRRILVSNGYIKPKIATDKGEKWKGWMEESWLNRQIKTTQTPLEFGTTDKKISQRMLSFLYDNT